MTRSTKHTLKYINKEKYNLLDNLFEDYKNDLVWYIKLVLCRQLSLKKLLSSKELPIGKIQHSQWRTIIYKQASEIVRGNLAITKKRVYSKYKKLYATCIEKGKLKSFTRKRFSELKIDYFKRIEIDIKNISIMVDERVLSFKETDTKEFDEFVGLRLPYFKEGVKRARKINLPIKQHKHSLKFKDWNRKKSIRLRKTQKGVYELSFTYEKEDLDKKLEGEWLGIDLGYKKAIADSNNNFYGEDLENIYIKLSNKKRGSKKYKRLLIHKNNEINRIVNEFYELNPRLQTLICEDLNYVKYKSKLHKKTNNRLQYWSYKNSLDKLERLSEEEGFCFLKVNPAYTSQLCSNCGELDKSARQGEIYQCKSCGLLIDADTNGAKNILHRGIYSSSTEKT